MTNSFSHIRAMPTCPRCAGDKDHGLVICWPCNRVLKARYDGTWGPWDAKLAVIEGGLSAQYTRVDAGTGRVKPLTDR